MSQIAILSVVYNGVPYLSKTIESVLNQSFKDYTYYICNNGSTDGTKECIMNYVSKDARIVYLEHGENIYHEAFNEALELILKNNHSYMFNLDGDDYLEEHALEDLMKLTTSHKEIVVGGSRAIEYGSDKIVSLKVKDKDYSLNSSEYKEHMEEIYPSGRTMWGKLYSIDVIKEAHTLSDISYGADTIFFFDALAKSKELVFSKEIIYNYVLRKDSISHDVRPSRYHAAQIVYEHLREVFEAHDWLNDANEVYLLRTYLLSVCETVSLLKEQPSGSDYVTINEILNEEEIDVAYQYEDVLINEFKNQVIAQAMIGFDAVLNALILDIREKVTNNTFKEEHLLVLKRISILKKDMKIYGYVVKLLAELYFANGDIEKVNALKKEIEQLQWVM